MALGERIKKCRQSAGMSQEKVAELVGVSRQAVTKWEANQSAPNTENLFKLAGIFGTTVDLLLAPDEGDNQTPAEKLLYLCKLEEDKKAETKKKRCKKNITAALLIAAAYILVYLAGRFIWCDLSHSSLLGWLFTTRPTGEHGYLYGWLLSSNLFWYAMAISVIPSLFGKYKFAIVTTAAFVLGIVLGMICGPYPEGAAMGRDHYGWAVWGGIYLLSIIAGVLAERFIKRDMGV